MMYPDYQRVDNPEANKRFEALWETKLEKKPGLTVVEVIRAADAGQVRGMYIMGENPAMSDPDAEHARAAMAKLEHLVVQDIFLTETCYLANVVLPATAWPEKDGTVTNTDRMVQLGRKAIEPPGEAKPDLWIINEIARRIGLAWDYTQPKQVFDEMRKGMNSIAGITWERLERDSCVVYPCENECDPGQPGAQPEARSLRQNPGIQVLRGAGEQRRCAARQSGLRQGACAERDLRLAGPISRL